NLNIDLILVLGYLGRKRGFGIRSLLNWVTMECGFGGVLEADLYSNLTICVTLKKKPRDLTKLK
ncbi:hypothetical protein, partial [Clostridium sp.]|uniref:hypothetical protein n=1 Tax=Clostridium sp. TaxID=1506 RepID=UPI0025B93E0C